MLTVHFKYALVGDMSNLKRRRQTTRNCLSIVVNCWNDSIEKHLRRVGMAALREGCAVSVRISAAKRSDHNWLSRQ